jgi:inner membrane protein
MQYLVMVLATIIHIASDGLTEGGVPLLWPYRKRYGFPPDPHWRFRSGDWPEYVIVYSLMLLVGFGIWQAVIRI